jgi:type II secretory pathway pseudopilin PulG
MKVFPVNAWIPAFAGMTIRRSRTKVGKLNSMKNKGFTLIEIIVLIVMAGILLPAIVVPFVTGVKGSGKPEMATRAMYLGQQRMEELMKFNYINAALSARGFTSFSTGDPTYLGQDEIVYVNSNLGTPSGDVGYKQICVRITDPGGTNYDIYAVVTNFP